MSIWYAIWDALPFEMLHWDFMKNALLALLLMAPLFGILSTMIVTGRMSFFSDALGHSAFTGIAIGIICGVAAPIWAAVGFSVVFALLFSFVRSRSNQAADTLIGVFSSSAVALGIFVATVGGGSFTRYNKYLIGDILSVTPGEIGMLALVLLAAGYVAYVFIDYHRIGDQELTVERNAAATVEAGKEYGILSYNIGFGAYEDDYSFFMDGGTGSVAESPEVVREDILGSAEAIRALSPASMGEPKTG